VSLETKVDNRFIVVCCDFTSSTLGCRWRSNPRSSLRFNIPWSTHQPLSSPIAVDLERGPSHQCNKTKQHTPRSSMLHILFRTPGQVLFCFVWESRHTTNSLDPSARVWERIQSVGLIFFCFVVRQPNSVPITSGTHTSVYSLFFCFVFVFPPHS